MGKLAVIGKTAVEIVISVNERLEKGATAFADKYETRPGGRGGYAAYCAKMCGSNVSICSRVGKDGNASRLRYFLYENGVSTGSLFTETSLQTPLDIYVRDDMYSSAYHISHSGTSGFIRTSDVAHLLEEKYDMALVQYESLGENGGEISKMLYEKNTRIFADFTASDDPLIARTLPPLEAIFLSENGAAALGTSDTSSLEACLRCCIDISKSVKAEYYLILLDDKGIFVYDGTYYNLISPCESALRTKVGFADVMCAAVCSVYLETRDMTAALEVGVICDKIARESRSIYVPSIKEARMYARELGLSVRFK